MGGPARREVREFLDTPGQDPRELAQLFRDIRRANHCYGGRRLVLRYLRGLVRLIPHRPISVLDVATGDADMPLTLCAWAAGQGIPVRVVAIDRSPEILALAEGTIAHRAGIALVQADALALPFTDGAFDIVLCGLALHHLTLASGAAALREIDRVAAGAFVVNDVVRSWASIAATWLDTRLFARSALARHDGPASVRQAFTLPELRRMIRLAGIGRVEITRHPAFRVALVRRPQRAPA